ncbi:hypothetical protein GJ744_011164 [Endocarpon pusillum]|uniref:F-box domain-containing protein n=1 Tax=Endocarpon pusillum TaxID=364733 RepID=A0A8H7E3M7_9EURO|nr:hypothetical protein GJ744_011164 [Endocarpon pusillum]
MTARRPSRISGDIPNHPPRDEEPPQRLFAMGDDRWEDAVPGNHHDSMHSQTIRFARDLPDETDIPVVHPALTNYGPDSAADFFRQARAYQQPPTQGPASSHLAKRRSRGHKSWLPGPGRLSQYDTSTEDADLPNPSQAENKFLSDSFGTPWSTRQLWHRAREELAGNNENSVPSRRRGPKRARRTSIHNERYSEDKPQPHDSSHSVAVLRSMRFRQAEVLNQEAYDEERPSDGDALDIWGATTNPEAHSRSNALGSAALTKSSVHNLFRVTREEDVRENDNLPGVPHLPPNSGDDAPSADHQWSLHQTSRAQRARTGVVSRRSRLPSPPHMSQAYHRQSLRDRAIRPTHEPIHQEYRESDGNGNSNGDDFVDGQSFAELNLPRSAQGYLGESTSSHDDEDCMPPPLPHLMSPNSFPELKKRWRRPASTMSDSDLFGPHQSLSRHEQVKGVSQSPDLFQRSRVLSTERNPTSDLDGIEAVMSDNTFALGNTTILSASNYEPTNSAKSLQEPFMCRPRGTGCGWPDIPTEIYLETARYLSREDALNLRLVCRDFSIAMMGAVFGSVVVPFGKAMYDINAANWERSPRSGSMFAKYGLAIRKFGISFEVDTDMLARAQTKTISDEQSSWWGKYSWPTPVYPRFNHLHKLENLADNISLLKSAMAHLGKTHELGLSIDSGHGWLHGPDISDMALFNDRCGQRTRVFGKNLSAGDKRKQAIRLQLFEYAQTRTLHECMEIVQRYNRLFTSDELTFLRSVTVRDLQSFQHAVSQPDFDGDAHTGGAIPSTNATANAAPHANGGPPAPAGPQPPNGGMNAGMLNLGAAYHQVQQTMFGQVHHNNPPMHAHPAQHNAPTVHPTVYHTGLLATLPMQYNPALTNTLPQLHFGQRQAAHERSRNRNNAGVATWSRPAPRIQPQFPIIMNGYNVSAEVGGWCPLIQKKVAPPRSFPLQPGSLTEAQAQWLMETVWAQRAFLSAYITSILANKDCFAQVHSLHIARISSGLLSSLEQKELWQGLPGLTTLSVLVSPDWRAEHITGDQNFNSNMLVSPVDASVQLSAFLKTHIAPLEKLSNLTIGFIGGGEHATGIMARNQHVLPAPISLAPRSWLSNHVSEPDSSTIVTFSHIKHLTVQNAWLSPLMLEAFMIRSRDTSLRTLTLKSMSLTATHSQRLVAPLSTATDSLEPIHPPSMWLYESLPTTHCWPATIDRITPGATFLERKYDAGLAGDPYTNPRPPPSFRGFVSRLVFVSCGYVRVSGVSIQELNQNDLVLPNTDPMDAGLKARAAALAEKGVMLSDKNANTGADWPLLGKLTQCIHPIEKRVLEQAWGMRFGWEDDVERWAAVEDGCFEGGTGRFSGVIIGEGGKGIGLGAE